MIFIINFPKKSEFLHFKQYLTMFAFLYRADNCSCCRRILRSLTLLSICIVRAIFHLIPLPALLSISVGVGCEWSGED